MQHRNLHRMPRQESGGSAKLPDDPNLPDDTTLADTDYIFGSYGYNQVRVVHSLKLAALHQPPFATQASLGGKQHLLKALVQCMCKITDGDTTTQPLPLWLRMMPPKRLQQLCLTNLFASEACDCIRSLRLHPKLGGVDGKFCGGFRPDMCDIINRCPKTRPRIGGAGTRQPQAIGASMARPS